MAGHDSPELQPDLASFAVVAGHAAAAARRRESGLRLDSQELSALRRVRDWLHAEARVLRGEVERSASESEARFAFAGLTIDEVSDSQPTDDPTNVAAVLDAVCAQINKLVSSETDSDAAYVRKLFERLTSTLLSYVGSSGETVEDLGAPS
jgi:hypothetical protein